MTDKKIPQRKEVALGVANKSETRPVGVKVANKKCGGKVAKKK
jgi:hypothetical protein